MSRYSWAILIGTVMGCAEPVPPPAAPSAPPTTPPAGMPAATTPAAPPPTSTATNPLDGKWVVTSLLKGGKESLPAGTLTLEFRNGHQIMALNGQVIDDVEFRFDPTTMPMHLDTIHPGPGGNKVINEGLVEILDDEMRICVAAGRPRPSEFDSTADNGYNLTSLKKSP